MTTIPGTVFIRYNVVVTWVEGERRRLESFDTEGEAVQWIVDYGEKFLSYDIVRTFTKIDA